MKFSIIKFLINFTICIVALSVGVLAVLGKISAFWIIPAILVVGFTKTRAWFLTIPFGKEKEHEAAERVKTRVDNQHTI